MRGTPDAGLGDLAATIAVTRLVLGPSMRIQAPPNLIGDQYALILAAGIDDWGGVSPLTPDHVNPERPWPQIDDLAAHTTAAGFTLRERLTAYPGYLREPWLDPRLTAHVAALADPGTGLASESAIPRGLPWQEPDGGWGDATGRTDLHVTIDTTGRTKDRRDDFAEVYGDWDEIGARIEPAARHAAPAAAPPRLRADVRAALRKAERDPAGLTDAQALALLDADGPELDALAALADALRAEAAGEDVSYVVTRNINFTNVCYTGCRFCALAQRRTDADAYTPPDPGRRPGRGSPGGGRHRGVHAGRHPPDLPGTAYFDPAAEVKRRCPDIHVHAFSPMEVMNGHRPHRPAGPRVAGTAREAYLGSLPGTAAEILTMTCAGCSPRQAAYRRVDRGDYHRARTRHPDLVDDDVRARGHPGALGRALQGDPPHPGAHRRLHRVRAAAVRARKLADLPGRAGQARPDAAGEPGQCTRCPAAAARRDQQHPVLLGQASGASACRDVLTGGVNDLRHP
jgi:FO synthase